MPDARLTAQLPHTLSSTDFPTLGQKYQGKVRDTYAQGDRLVLITTDRLSAFDHVLTTLPFKGDLLNTLAHFWFQKTAHVVKNHVLDMPDPCVIVGRRAEPFKVEFVLLAFHQEFTCRVVSQSVEHSHVHANNCCILQHTRHADTLSEYLVSTK